MTHRNNIQGVPYENQELASLPVKPEVNKKRLICQKMTFAKYIRCAKFQKCIFKNKEKKEGVVKSRSPE